MKNKHYKFILKPVFFIAALILTSIFIIWIETVRPSDFGFYKDIFKKETIIKKSDVYPLRKSSDSLTPEEFNYAKIAWKYFENNYQPETGFVNSVNNYPSTTLWDLSSYLLGMLSAYELNVIDSVELDMRIKKCFTTMRDMPLYDNILPNKVYNTISMEMTDYKNVASEEGVGWSAIDIGRFYTLVHKVRKDYSHYYPLLEKVISNWKINRMVVNGTMYSVVFRSKDKSANLQQEGKLGYEEYCSKGLLMAGYDVYEAMIYTDFIRFRSLYDIEIGTDTREVKYNPAYNYILSEPYFLDGIEHGWDNNSRELAYRVFKVQKERYKRENIITCVSEDHIDTIPYFVYNSVYADGAFWNCIAENGEDASAFKSISTKAAFAWYVLFDDDYTNIVFDKIKTMYDPNRGWYSGLYEESKLPNKAITANTNGVILESLNYKVNGPISSY